VGDPANRVISANGPLLVRCANGEELRADSAVIYQSVNEVHLFRQVDYQDPGRSLTSDAAIYNSGTGRLFATGNVVFTDKNRGSTLRGPELEYYRAMPGRPEAQMTATQRPHVTVRPRGGGSGEGRRRRDPMEIDGDRVTSLGDRYLTATGNVVINDNGTRSTAQEAFYDQTAEHVELRRQARVDNERYQLSGDLISSDLKNGSVSRVVAQREARLVSERPGSW
jgi:lipopolysaccharide assembly outer membrane protein LptD (OstA)